MSYQADLIEQFYIHAQDSYVNLVLPTIVEVFNASGRLQAVQVASVQDVVSATDSVVTNNYRLVRDEFFVASTSAATSHLFVSYVEKFKVSDAATGRLVNTYNVVEVFTAVSRSLPPNVWAKLSDVFYATDSSVVYLTNRLFISDVFRVTDYSAPAALASAVDQFTVLDSADWRGVKYVYSASEEFYASSSIGLGSTSAQSFVVDRFFAHSSVIISVAHTAVASEEFYIHSVARAYAPRLTQLTFENSIPLSETDAWTADARVWAMSRYIDFPVLEFADNKIGVGRKGVYRATLDSPLSYIETGVMPLLDQGGRITRKKRINYVYTYSVHNNPLRILVRADYNGISSEYFYTQEPRVSDRTRAVRCPIGRGLFTNYFQIRIGGPAFDITAVDIQYSVSDRRI